MGETTDLTSAYSDGPDLMVRAIIVSGPGLPGLPAQRRPVVDVGAAVIVVVVVPGHLLGLGAAGGLLGFGLALGVGLAAAVVDAVDAGVQALAQLGLGAQPGGPLLQVGGLLPVVVGAVLGEPGAAPDAAGVDLAGLRGALLPLAGELGQLRGRAAAAIGAAGLAFVLSGPGVPLGLGAAG
jgi:hypothetical protein